MITCKLLCGGKFADVLVYVWQTEENPCKIKLIIQKS